MSGTATAKRVFLSLLTVCVLNACTDADAPRGNATVPSPPPPPTSPPNSNAADAMVTSRAAALPDFTQLVEAQGPAVVNVVTTRHRSDTGPGILGLSPDDPLFNFFRRFIPDFPPPGGTEQRGLGSGFVISEDGLILTNAHVVADARSVIIRLADGKKEFPGKVVGIDSRSDVALVKIDATGLPVANLGNSATVKPGEWVAAIGSPFGFANTITAGIVSATNRELPDDAITPVIQTDVAVNPGNSGGPLINMAGEVIGINSMIYSGTGGYMGVSFAIPIETALDVAKQLQSQGKVTRGSLGLAVQPMTDELAQAFRLKAKGGVLISAVKPGGPADKAGLKSGDVILEYDGQAIDKATQLPRLVANTPPGSAARLAIWRDGARREVRAKVGETAPERVVETPGPDHPQANGPFGLVLGELPPALRRHLGIDYGLLVQAVKGAAADAPVRPGDVIIAVNQARFSSAAEFHRILARHKAGDKVALLLRRGDEIAYVIVKVRG